MTGRELRIKGHLELEDASYYALSTAHGWLETVYRRQIRQYTLANIEVTKQRESIGKFLMESGLQHARRLKASYVVGLIISRECLDAMTHVFGEENIQVNERGKYASEIHSDKDTTSAMLYYEIEDSRADHLDKEILRQSRPDLPQ